MFAYLDSVVCLHSRIICVGTKNWQSNPQNVSAFADLVALKVHVVQNGGHMLPTEYVSNLLDKWLA